MGGKSHADRVLVSIQPRQPGAQHHQCRGEFTLERLGILPLDAESRLQLGPELGQHRLPYLSRQGSRKPGIDVQRHRRVAQRRHRGAIQRHLVARQIVQEPRIQPDRRPPFRCYRTRPPARIQHAQCRPTLGRHHDPAAQHAGDLRLQHRHLCGRNRRVHGSSQRRGIGAQRHLGMTAALCRVAQMHQQPAKQRPARQPIAVAARFDGNAGSAQHAGPRRRAAGLGGQGKDAEGRVVPNDFGVGGTIGGARDARAQFRKYGHAPAGSVAGIRGRPGSRGIRRPPSETRR